MLVLLVLGTLHKYAYRSERVGKKMPSFTAIERKQYQNPP